MDIEAMKSELREMKMQSNYLRKKIAEAQAQFNIGDRVTYDGSQCIWEITSIGYGYSGEPKYYGSKINNR